MKAGTISPWTRSFPGCCGNTCPGARPGPTGRRKPAACCIWPIWATTGCTAMPCKTVCPTGRWKPCACRRAAAPASPCPSPRAVLPWSASWTACCAFSGRTAPAALALPASGMPGANAPGGACRMGDTLFVGNRGPNTVSAFRLTPSGATFAGEWPAGNWPRHLACLGEGLLLAACSRDDAVWSYRWDGRNLTRQDVLPLHQASCVLPLP